MIKGYKTRIIVMGTDHRVLDEFMLKVREIAEKTGAKYSGPVYLPTRRLVVPTRRSPCGQGSELSLIHI